MPLFTSSSKHNNKKAWLLSWALTLLIVITVLISYECFLKNHSFNASITDNQRLWSWYRAQASGTDKKLVLLGASRSQLNLNIPYLKQQLTNHDVLQLSINAQYPMTSLAALAEDTTFHGTVLISLNAQALEQRYLDMQQAYNDFYQDSASFDQPLNAYLLALLQSRFRFLHPSLGLKKVVTFYQQHKRFPQPPYTTAHVDRSIAADYRQTDISHLQKHFFNQKKTNYLNDPPTPVTKWLNNIVQLKQHITAIENRGGRVIVLRFPTDKGHWQLDEHYYPRQVYWNVLMNDPDITALHFADINGINALDLPDSSHLDFRQSIPFTKALLQYLLDQQLITP